MNELFVDKHCDLIADPCRSYGAGQWRVRNGEAGTIVADGYNKEQWVYVHITPLSSGQVSIGLVEMRADSPIRMGQVMLSAKLAPRFINGRLNMAFAS